MNDLFAGTDLLARRHRGPRWSTDRRPFVIALVVVIVIVACGYGLQAWGPLNPAIQSPGGGGGTRTVDGVSVYVQQVTLANPSFSEVMIEQVEVSGPNGPPVAATDVSFAVIADTDPSGAGTVGSPTALPIQVEPRSRFVLSWTLPASLCPVGSTSQSAQFATRSVITFRSSWGRELTFPTPQQSMTCSEQSR